jgi:putative SOS response-associated peptidase YedK
MVGKSRSRRDRPPWLDSGLTDRETLRQVVHYLRAERIIHWPVSQRVNKSTENDSDLIEPVNGQ